MPGSGPRIRLRFGRELYARPIWRESFAAVGQPLDVNAVANYIAKYATKAADVPGLPATRIRTAAAITALRCSAHPKRIVATAWQLEKIARLVGHTGTATTELVYRKQIRPVVTGGAQVMDSLFPRRDTDA